MSDDSSLGERLKRRVFGRDKKDSAKPKAQNSSPKYGAASSTNLTQDAVLRPSENVGPSTIIIPPALPSTLNSSPLLPAGLRTPLDTTSNTSLNNTGVEATAVISQTVTADQAADITDDSARDCSLWDTAYDALKKEKPDRITAYEDLLSRVPTRAQAKSRALHKTDDADEVTNQIPQHDVIARREKLKHITELGLKYMEDKKVSATLLGHEIILQDVVANVAGAVKWTEDYVKDAVKDLPYASIVVVGVSLVLPLLKNPSAAETANQDGFTYVTSQMRYYVAMESLLLPEDMKSDLRADLTDRLVDLYKLIIDFQVQTVLRFYRSRTKNFFRGTINYDSWDKKLQDIKDGDKELVLKFETAISATNLNSLKNLAKDAAASRSALYRLLKTQQELVQINRDQLGIAQDYLGFAKKMDQRMSDAENRACLRDLQTTNPCKDKDRIEQDKGGLLRDSYYWVLENAEFQGWRDVGQNQLLWIKGDPGKGKTMLLCGIIDELIKSTSDTANISFFFCQATDDRINNATAVLRGLLYLLVKQQQSLISHIREIYDDSGKQGFEGVNAWVALSKIFTNILEDPRLRSTYLIIDALDECTTDLSLLLNLVAQMSSAQPNVKWIVSSRNWPEIEEQLDKATQKVRLCLELNDKSISAAVTTYIKWKVEQLAKQKKYDNDLRGAIQRYLSSNAKDTFLWVALVCKELADPKVRQHHTLKKLCAFPAGLDALYRRMMDQICDSEDAELCNRILAIISVVYRPITLDELTSFVDMPDGVSNDGSLTDIIALCGSFLTLREHTISFVHQSAKDFLIGKSSKEIFPSGIEHKHYTVFSRSLQVMSKTLRRDVYSLRAPGVSIDQVNAPNPDPLAAVQYSCLYWIEHLLRGDTIGDTTNNLEYSGLVAQFLYKSYLYWLEALSLMKSLSSGILIVRKLENWLQANEYPDLYAFVHDAKRFALYNRSMIEQTPLQLYCSALIFAPQKSVVRVAFENCIPPWIERKPKMQARWKPLLQTLEGHSSSVFSVAFSPNGRQVVSGSSDNTVRLWDAVTGAALQTLKGHSHTISSVAFSPDSKQVVSGSVDNTVRLWDAVTGVALQTLEGHSSFVDSVAFSPNGKQVVSGSVDNTVRLWDAVTGIALQTLEGHSSSVHSVAFSPNGKQVVSGSADNTVRLWDAISGVVLQMLKGHSSSAFSVAFSPNGKQVVSGSVDNTVRLWDAVTGAALQTLEGHSSSVHSVAFSPDSKQVVSGSADNTVRLWDAVTGAALQTLKDHSNSIRSVAFSPDSKQVVSGSWDNTVQLWDATSGVVLQMLKGHSSDVNSVAFSPDGKQAVSGSSDKTVRLWDAVTGAALQTLEGHSSFVRSVAFSPNGKQVVSSSGDNTVRLWDAATGAALQTLEGHSYSIYSIAFSPDSKQVVSGSRDNTVRLWDTVTGAALQILKGHSHTIYSVAFSPDSKQVVSGSRDNTVRLWDAITGAALQTLKGHSHSIKSVAFSPDGKQVVSGSKDNTVRLWDATIGAALQTLKGHSHSVFSVAFSPNGKQVVSSSGDNTVRLWDAVTGTALQILKGYSSSVDSVAFSPDGRLLPNLLVSDRWIVEADIEILWLPFEYQSICQTTFNGAIILGHSSGQISILKFTQGPKLII